VRKANCFCICVFTILLNSFDCFSQGSEVTYNSVTREISQEMTVITGRSKDKTFGLIRSFLAKEYKSYKQTTILEDMSLGQIVFPVTEPIRTGRFTSFKFTATIDIKDDKYRCTIDHIKVLEKGSLAYQTFDFGRAMTENNSSLQTEYLKTQEIMSFKFSTLQSGIRDAVVPINDFR